MIRDLKTSQLRNAFYTLSHHHPQEDFENKSSQNFL